MIQGLVLFIAGWHNIIEAPALLQHVGVPFIIPTSLFLVPVVYAALAFGLAGAITTALWSTLLTIPNWIFWHRGVERFECITYLLIVNVVAILVGQQVDRQKKAWQRVEASTAALQSSERKYRALLESSPVAILAVKPEGIVVQANSAAGTLFGKNKVRLGGMSLADLFGATDARKLLTAFPGSRKTGSLTLKRKDGTELYLDPKLSKVDIGGGESVIQIILRDATEEHQQRAGLRAYAGYAIRAYEEERRVIARELHDETIQELVLLCRQLDILESDDSNPLSTSQFVKLRDARRTVEQVMQGLRDFTKALRPPILDDLGLIPSIRLMLDDLAQRSSMESQLRVVGEERRLPSHTELVMFRIAQEAIRNVERHARASSVIATITFTERDVKIDVADNGIGFSLPSNSSDFTASGHIGLISMQERAGLVGGKLTIKSSPGKGTRATVSVPAAKSVGAESPTGLPFVP
ncbi:MAG: hypothetical protein HW402_1150 [Dehalococcoidales bacterium]|nr:hypothetical protein [Dehalococcoidales bacterium]